MGFRLVVQAGLFGTAAVGLNVQSKQFAWVASLAESVCYRFSWGWLMGFRLVVQAGLFETAAASFLRIVQLLQKGQLASQNPCLKVQLVIAVAAKSLFKAT
jgi:hypothetical protein